MRNGLSRSGLVATGAALLVSGLAAAQASAQIHVTEWAYQGTNGEFVELTNRGAGAVDLTGWSFDDDSAIADTVDLSGFGVVQPGESVLITEGDATAVEAFRTAWGLSASVKILSSGGVGFGRNDVYNVFDASDTLVETFAYGDQNFPGTFRTQNVSANILPADLGSTTALASMPGSSVGDQFNSYTSTGGDIGNPGIYVPEPASLGALGAAVALIVRRSRR